MNKKHLAAILVIVMAFTILPGIAAADTVSAVTTLKTPTLYNHAADDTSVKNYWSKVDGAKGYQLYRATKKTDKYKKIITTTKTSYTDKKLKNAEFYYYKVRAYKKVNGKYKYSKSSKIQVAQPLWKYSSSLVTSMSGKSKKTQYMTVRITNKGVKTMKVECDGDYVVIGDSGDSFDFADYVRGVMYRASNQKKKYSGGTTISPGKTVSLTYVLDSKIHYNKNATLRIYFELSKRPYIADINSKGNLSWGNY